MWNRILLSLTRALFHLLGRLPESVRERGAICLGRLVYAADRRHRRIAIENLRMAFDTQIGEQEIRTIARGVFENLCRIVFEIGWAMRLPVHEWPRFFKLSGVDHYEKAAAHGKGVLMLVAHFGNWELLPIIARIARMEVRIAYRSLDAAFLDRFIFENRSRFGAVMIPARRGAMQKMYLALRRGYPVALLADQNEVLHKGVFSDFFGHPACTNTTLALLSLRSGAPVIPVFLIREGRGFRAEFGKAVYPVRSGDQTRDIEENTQIYTRIIESYIRRHPDQWFWVHQRWRTKNLHAWPDPVRRARWLKNHPGGVRS